MLSSLRILILLSILHSKPQLCIVWCMFSNVSEISIKLTDEGRSNITKQFLYVSCCINLKKHRQVYFYRFLPIAAALCVLCNPLLHLRCFNCGDFEFTKIFNVPLTLKQKHAEIRREKLPEYWRFIVHRFQWSFFIRLCWGISVQLLKANKNNKILHTTYKFQFSFAVLVCSDNSWIRIYFFV